MNVDQSLSLMDTFRAEDEAEKLSASVGRSVIAPSVAQQNALTDEDKALEAKALAVERITYYTLGIGPHPPHMPPRHPAPR